MFEKYLDRAQWVKLMLEGKLDNIGNPFKVDQDNREILVQKRFKVIFGRQNV